MTFDSRPSLLLSDDAADAEIRDTLLSLGFTDWHTAHSNLRRIAAQAHLREAFPRLLPHLLTSLSTAANPGRVLVNLDRFVHTARGNAQILGYLASDPRTLEILVTLFAASQFLTEILLRNPEYLEVLMVHKRLPQPKSLSQFYEQAQACTLTSNWARGSPTYTAERWIEHLDALRRFQRWELLRIGACDLLALFDLPVVTGQLSHLADSIVRAGLTLASAQSGIPIDGFAVIAMGKLGGDELNYSSDIDLLFIATSDATGYSRLGERLIDALTRITAEGFLYRVDMRLRPWGQVGALVSSLDGYVAYMNKHARLWEKQALLKARVIAGDSAVGNALLHQIEPLLFNADAAAVRADVFGMKRRTENQLRERGRAWGQVKLGEGSIRDIEFVVQYLQLAHGGERPEVRSRNTLDALAKLLRHSLLQADEHRVLHDGYIFFRTIEHHLQMMHYRQTHALPDDPDALVHLALRLGFQGSEAGAQFIARYEQHRAAIRLIYLSHLGSKAMENQTTPQSFSAEPRIHRHVGRMDPSYGKVFSEQEIRLHATLAEQLDETTLIQVYATPLDDDLWRVTLVGYDYPGELSLICGLLFVYGLSIQDGNVFTYEPVESPTSPAKRPPRTSSDRRRKIVDVFTVRPVQTTVTDGTWEAYREELGTLLRLLDAGKQSEAQGALAKRVAAALHGVTGSTATLYPIAIDIDNAVSDRYTVLRIDAADTIGFLYEFTNALAFNRIYIARVTVDSDENRVNDVLYVTDAAGAKITAPERQRELRAATVLVKHFTHLLPHSPDPEGALLRFRQFIGQLFRRSEWPDELASLERPEVLDALAQLLGVSGFLWDDFLRMQYANLFPVVRDIDALATSRSRDQLQAELEAELRPVHSGPQQPSDDVQWRKTLNAFKDREMLRVDMRHILGHTAEFWDFSEGLTDLAEVVVNSAYHLCHEDLRTVHGTPCLEDGQVSEMSVCALGKCGGCELGFASDIELMFIYAGNGRTTGPQAITTAEFYEKVVQAFVSAIQAKREGIFEIDLQLRPYGKSGSMAVSLEAFRRYFAPDGPAWAYERQALVKLRPIAGDAELGQQIAALRDRYVYTGEPFDVTAMRAMRERQVRHLVTGGTFNAKFSPGGLVDVEYLVQALQVTHGHRSPALRQTNIREAMAALEAKGALSQDDYTTLRRAHTFLRWLIDGLRMVRGNARDLTVPAPDSEAFAFLARRMRYGNDTARLRDDQARHTTNVQELNTRLLR